MTATEVPENTVGEAGCPVNGHNRHNLNKIKNQDQKIYIMGHMLGVTVRAQGRQPC